MKFTHFILASTALAALIAYPINVSAQNAEVNTATVANIIGTAKVAHNGGNFSALTRGAKLVDGDVIQTGPASRVDLQVGNHVGLVGVTANSTFGITKLTTTKTAAETVHESSFRLDRGAIYAKVNKTSKASNFEIATPRGIAGVRGTSIYLTAEGELTVETGTAGIVYQGPNGPQTFVLHDGETIRPGDAAPAPAPPQVLRDINQIIAEIERITQTTVVTPYVPPQEIYVSPIQPSSK